MSTFNVRVKPVDSNNILTPMPIGMAKLPKTVPYDIAAVAGQPTSITFYWRQKFCTIVVAAGPKLSFNKFIIRFKRINTIRKIKNDRTDYRKVVVKKLANT